MRILFAADEHSYSAKALPQVARLGKNTWADITLLLINSKNTPVFSDTSGINDSKTPPVDGMMETYHQQLLGYLDPKTSPYSQVRSDGNAKNGFHKHIFTRVRRGNPTREILEEAKKDDSDLIVIGCSTQKDCTWKESGNVPLKVARDADCSVMIIKEEKKINRVLCCLDHDNISQESLEMVSQMVTLFHADLDIVVLTEKEDVQKKIEEKLSWLINYYSTKNIFPYIELVKLASLEAFISQEARWGLIAMWMGKKSILERVFPTNKLSRLLKANESSVLLLR